MRVPRWILAALVVALASLCACGGGGGSTPGVAPSGAATSVKPTAPPSSGVSAAPSTAPSASASATTVPSASASPIVVGTPTPTPAPVAGAAVIVSSANSAYGGALVLVAPDGSATFPVGKRDYAGGPDSDYSVASFQTSTGVSIAPSGGWLPSSGSGLVVTTSPPPDVIVTPPPGGTYVVASQIAPTGSHLGALQGTLTAQSTSITTYTYARFALACGPSPLGFPSAIAFNSNGDAVAAPPGAGDLFFDSTCAAIHFAGGITQTDSLQAGNTPFPPFANIRTTAYQALDTQITYVQLSKSDMPSGALTTTVGPGYPVIISSVNTGYVKLLFTYRFYINGTYFVSGAYEVHQGPPGDLF